MPNRRPVLLLGAALALALSYACGSGSSDSASNTGESGGHAGSAGGAGDASVGGDASAGSGGGLLDGGNSGPVQSLSIDPPSATIDVTNGASTPATFQAIAHYANGTTGPVAGSWQFDRPQIALVGPSSGVVTANGETGGVGTLTVTVGQLTATAQVTVDLHVTDNPAGLGAADQAKFGSPDGTPSGTMLYPYDETVFARGILAPELMWSGGAAGDVYLVHLHEDHFDAQIFTTADPPSAYTMSDAVWNALTTSNAGEKVQIDVQRMSGGQAHASMHETWTIAQGSLRGTIYYWAVNTGQLMKIAPGASSPTVVFDSGPADQLGTPAPAGYNGATPPWESGGNDKRCVACHTVSKDGSKLAAVFEKKGSTASPWGTIDLTASPPSVTQLTPYTSSAIYLALTPDGANVVQNDNDMTMSLHDATTGAAIPSALDAFTDKTADPVFSPDGKLLAFSSNASGYYPVEFFRADLDVMDYDASQKAFANRRTIANGGTEAIAFPSFSPDSKWALYQKGDYSRAKYGTSSVGHDDLYMTDVAGQVGEIPLSNASGASLDAKNQHISYQPTVNPVAVGGYLWVVFFSPRDYGNKMQSASNPTYENRKQLWVAAVDLNPQPGTDPSHPAFWLPGQDLSTVNMSGYWALEPCHQTGTTCNEGYECCTGFCRADADGGAPTCVPPPGGCSNAGESCTTDSDCCAGASSHCIGGVCGAIGPH